MSLPTDVIGNILVFACESPKDAAARRWCLSRAWLEAHGAPALWRTLTLSTLPTDSAHCIMSAWVRAPQRLRRAVGIDLDIPVQRAQRLVEVTLVQDLLELREVLAISESSIKILRRLT